MGVPNQTELNLSYSLVEAGGGGSNSSSPATGNRVKPPPSPPDSGGGRVKPLPSPPKPTLPPKPTPLNTATFAAQETAKFDCGRTVEMWYMCRLFSPRRRQRRRSSSDSHGQQQEGQEKEDSVEDSVPQRPQRPEPQAGPGSAPKNVRSGGVAGDMDGSEEDEAQDCDDLMLDSDLGDTTDNSAGACNGEGDASTEQDAVDTVVDSGTACVSDRDRGSRNLPAGNVTKNVTEGDEGLKEQLAMVQAMVQEMKVGFMAALDQLSTMQEGEQSSAWHEVDTTCKRQDQQLSDFAQSMESLRAEVCALSGSVNQVISTQQSLQDRLIAVQTGQQHLLEELVSAGVLSQKSRDILSKYSLKGGNFAEDVNNHRSHQFTDAASDQQATQEQEQQQQHVTAAACKSLSLTQALAARCQDIDVSDSSEEDMTNSARPGHNGEDRHSRSVGGKSLSQNSAVDTPKRRQAVQEIVDSEQEYCTHLWTVVNVYQLPLQDGHYMSSRQLCILFPSPLAELCEQHCQMLHSLQDRLVHWSYAGVVGDVFARITDSNNNLLGLYQEYVESLPGAISCLRRQLAQSRSFRVFVKGQRESNPNIDLLSLLISPLQRIPKYMLQLQQVLRHTGEDHPDHFNLQASLAKLQDFVERFNHDITHTTQAIALDLQHLQAQGASFRSSASGSSCEVMPATTSTIDSGIHSTGEDTFSQRFIRTEHDGYLPKWLEQNTNYHHTDPRHAMAMQRRSQQHSLLNSQSHPDLTYTGYVMPNAMDPQASVPQIRSHSKMAAVAADRSARQRRYKIKKRMEGQGQFMGQSPMRPTSAIDFAEPQHRGEREQVVMRPHSVLGPFPGDGRNRVIQVYSRKPPRNGHRMSDSGIPQSVPLQHVMRSSPQPHIQINGHWDPAGGGDHANHHGHLVDYDDEEDDTRALSDTRSSSSQKQSSHNSQDAQETETDNSDDFSQEDLAAALSHHLNSGGGIANHHVVSAHDLAVNHHHHRQLQYSAQNGVDDHGDDIDDEEEEEDENVDVQLDSPESAYFHSSQHQPQRPPEDMSEELKLDLTCFQDDNEGKVSLQKRLLPTDPRHSKDSAAECAVPLSMKPMAGNCNNSSEIVPKAADRSQTEPPKEVVDSLSGDKTDKVTSLPPIHPQEIFPSVNDTNSRVLHSDIDRPVRRSVTPNEFSGVSRPVVLRRAATPSEYISPSDNLNSKAGRRKKDSKNASTENLHRSVDDVSLSASKKKPFRTSLKNLFHRKKGSVILDELEREYTKELVRRCLTKNGQNIQSSSRSNNHTTTSNNDINKVVGVGDGSDSSSKEEGEDETKDILGTNNHHHHNHTNSLWSKMRKSPLFFLYRSTDSSGSDTPA